MRDLDVEEIIAGMKKELHTLYEERSAVDRRMDTIKKALVGLATLYGDETLSIDFLQSTDPPRKRPRAGLTNICRSILMQSKVPLRTAEICRLVTEQNPDALKLHKNPSASVAVVLRRLVKKGQVHPLEKGRAKTEWTWVENCSSNATHSAGGESHVLSAREN
jgi:hypothetical protein